MEESGTTKASPVYLDGEDLFWENGKQIGNIFPDIDGFYKFWPTLSGGYWEAYGMRAIADLLDSMNKAWEEQIAKDLG